MNHFADLAIHSGRLGGAISLLGAFLELNLTVLADIAVPRTLAFWQTKGPAGRPVSIVSSLPNRAGLNSDD